jgi:hypothetical protein
MRRVVRECQAGGFVVRRPVTAGEERISTDSAPITRLGRSDADRRRKRTECKISVAPRMTRRLRALQERGGVAL